MCGIAGVWGSHDPRSIDSMISSMHHRGPDDQGKYCASRIALGMTRLAVIDLHPSGHQPMSTPDGKIWIIYNGEIFNFREERKILEFLGYSFRSSSDTEVVLRMYEHYGENFLNRLRGMYALAIYDIRKGFEREKLLLARDNLGIKPLLYSKTKNNLIFASEIKAILASGLIPPIIDPEGLRLLLSYGSVFQPYTIIKGVKMLPPAHRLIVEKGKPDRIERYWSLGIDKFPGVRGLPYEKQVRILDSALKNAIKSHMVSDVPLGAFLSGGVDSSIIVSMMTKLSDRKIKTFSVGFENEGSGIDESGDARRTADFIGTDHSHVLVKGSDVSEHIFNIARALDQPSVDGVNSYFVSLAARKAVTVAISGTGGDELFAGYPWFISMMQYQISQKIPSIKFYIKPYYAKKMLKYAKTLFHKPYTTKSGACEDGFLSYYASNYYIFGSDSASGLLTQNVSSGSNSGQEECVDLKTIDDLSSGSPVERVSGLCLRGYTCNQLLRDIDAVSMSHSLEVRVPYLDHEIVDLALSLPDGVKLKMPNLSKDAMKETYRSSGAKKILIDIGRSGLPKDFDLQPKRGFGMPFDTWLRGPLNSILDDTLSYNQIQARGWLKPEKVLKVKKRFNERRTGWAQPWLLMMLELWAREVLDNIAVE